ncbi:MAG: hypothetical protein ACI9CO_000017 [Candidatus Azotimanducaceae bacterium]|jgi:hypothetical protein
MTFTGKIFISTMLVSVVVSIVNYFVDPYRLYGEDKIGSMSKLKPHLDKKLVLSKLKNSIDESYDTVLIGTSRVEVGLDPKDKAFANRSVYNFGIPGASLGQEVKLLGHIASRQDLDLVLVQMDFGQFNRNGRPGGVIDPEYITYFESDILESTLIWLKLTVSDLASTHSLRDSIETLGSQNGNSMEFDRKRNGHRFVGGTFGKDVREQGNRNNFKVSESMYATVIYDRNDVYQFKLSEMTDSSGAYKDLGEIIDLSLRYDFDLVFFLGPSHARQWQLVKELNLWCDFMKWKRDLVYFFDDLYKTRGVNYPLWDFAHTNAITSESLPQTDNERMKYYMESSHYLPSLGSVVLSSLMGDGPSEIGYLLTSENVAGALKDQTNMQILYEGAFLEDVSMVRESASRSTEELHRKCEMG